MAVEHIEGPLKALPDRQGPHRLREVPVVHHDGVEGLAHGEALSPAEIPVPGGGAQIVPLRHGQEVLGPVGFHALDLGGPDAHGDDLVHGELCPAGNVGAKSHPDALLQHLPHRGHAAAQVDVGPGAVGHHHPGPADGGALPGVGVDAVGHHRVILPQSVLVVGLPVLLAVGVQLPHPVDLAGVLRQVGLDVQLPLPGQLPQRRHKLVGTAGREPRRDDGPDVFKMTPVQPPHRLADGLLRGFLQHPGQAVAVHIHLAYIAGTDNGIIYNPRFPVRGESKHRYFPEGDTLGCKSQAIWHLKSFV